MCHDMNMWYMCNNVSVAFLGADLNRSPFPSNRTPGVPGHRKGPGVPHHGRHKASRATLLSLKESMAPPSFIRTTWRGPQECFLPSKINKMYIRLKNHEPKVKVGSEVSLVDIKLKSIKIEREPFQCQDVSGHFPTSNVQLFDCTPSAEISSNLDL